MKMVRGLEKIINSIKAVTRPVVLAGALAVGSVCGCDFENEELTNNQPEIQNIADQTVEEGDFFDLDLEDYISDADDDTLTVEKVSGPGEIVDNFYHYEDLVDEDHDNNEHLVNFEVNDNKGGISLGSFRILQKDKTLFTEEEDEGEIIDETFNTYTHIIDVNDNEYDFTRTSLESLLIPPWFYHEGFNHTFPTGDGGSERDYVIDKMAVTVLGSDKLYHLFWFTEINQIERLDEENVRVYFNDSLEFEGQWVPGEKPIKFYGTGPHFGWVRGMSREDGIEVPRAIYINNIKSIDFDTTGSEEAFNEQYTSVLNDNFYPKTVELNDGRRFSTDLGFIIDCCGHYYRNNYHERLKDTCDLFLPDRTIKKIPLEELAEIEFTGEFGVNEINSNFYPSQCRQVNLSYKDGTNETGFLNLTSESHNGTCNHSAKFKDWDKFILYNDRGAIIVPLDDIKKVIVP